MSSGSESIRSLDRILFDDVRDTRVNLLAVDVIGARCEHRCLTRSLREDRAGHIAHIDLSLGRKSYAQWMRTQLVRVESNAHGNALYDFDPIAGRILRRQQREGDSLLGLHLQPGRPAGVDGHRLPGVVLAEPVT